MDEPALKKAMNTLEFLSQDEEMRQLYEARQKALRDEASMIADAKDEGRLEGKEEGRIEGKVEMIRTMVARGMSLSDIAKFTGISEEELNYLRALN